MPDTHAAIRTPAAVLAISVLLALGCSACGSSSGKSPAGTNAAQVSSEKSGGASSATTSTSPTAGGSTTTGTAPSKGGPNPGSARFATMRECLQKNGVTLPKPTSGKSPPRGGFRGDGALPKGVTRAQLQSALRKCGSAGGRLAGGGRRFLQGANRHGLQQAFAKFADCLRQNGINLPAPNTSGSGPIFNTKGLNTKGSQFKTATAKCRGVLATAFPQRRAPAGQSPAGAAPPPAG